jgi:subtilisin family serine protease
MKNFNSFRMLLIMLSGAVLISLTGSNNFSGVFKLSKSLQTVLNTSQPEAKMKVWVEFTDKGNDASQYLSSPSALLTQRSLERRAKVKPAGSLVDITDVPLDAEYVADLTSSGFQIVQRSKWFNRVSVMADREDIMEMTAKHYVKSVDIVRGFKKSNNDIEFVERPVIPESDHNIGGNSSQSMNYGSSLSQMQIINAVTAHDSGYYGQGVLIASFDTGVDNLQHPSFDSIRARGMRTYDFVNHDTIIGNQGGQMGEGSHGTETLSLVGGYRPGNLISPAFRARFIVAKTENTDSETPLEEDNWIAAAEWADSLGADIITSSLGYIGMDQGSIRSYDWTWMNGDSCIITIGADLAVNKGIVVCNSAGNEGFNSTHNTLGAPSDGDSVIAVGSVNSNRQRSSFSSVGLSVDGRIKPDVCALGNGNVVASPSPGTGYTSGSGTSFSCPMTAGVCAMILSANYSLTPIQVRELLKQTADSSFAPNRRRGWGLINAWESVKLAKMMTNTGTISASVPETFKLEQNYPNPFNPSTKISYKLQVGGYIELQVFDITGKQITSLVNSSRGAGSYEVEFNAAGLSSGVYFYSLIVDGRQMGVKRMTLLK